MFKVGFTSLKSHSHKDDNYKDSDKYIDNALQPWRIHDTAKTLSALLPL